MAKIIWNKNIELENKIEIEKYLTPFLWLVPQWCQKIEVNLTCANANYTAQILTRYEYRDAHLDVATDWLNQTAEKKTSDLVHELAHNFYNPLYLFALDNFDILLSENESAKYKQSMRESLRIFNELGTTDLAFAILNKFNEPKNAD
ncbi:MAG: hypothetical protein LH472_08490 [Pyrinomonadaceae bacterium]|nr:hypothetical protein [Pyrinomonadaceae bacterium]